MSGEVIKEFLVKLGFKTEGLGEFTAGIGKSTAAVAGLGAAIGAATALVFKFTSSVANQLDDLGDVAERVGTTAAAVNELGFIAQLTDSSVEAATSTLERFGGIAGQAAQGLGRGVKAFEALGVDVKDGNGKLKDTTLLLKEVGAELGKLSKGEQAGMARMLGIDATMLKGLTSDTAALSEEYAKLYGGLGIDMDKAAEEAGAFTDAIARIGQVFTAIGQAIASKFFGRFTRSMDDFRRMVIDLIPRIMDTLTPIITTILTLADVFMALAYRAGQAISVVIGWVMDIINILPGWATAILAVVAAWKWLNLAFLASPIGIVLALAAAIGLLIDDFMTWKEGGTSLLPWEEWKAEIELVEGILIGFRDVIAAIFDYIFTYIDMVVQLITGDFARAFDLFKSILDKFKAGFEFIGGGLNQLGEMFGAGGEPSAALSPSPGDRARMSGNQSVNQQTTITVNGATDPQETAKAVGGAQNEVNAGMARNLKPRVR